MDEYIHNMRNIISAQKAKNKIKSKWYKRVPFKKTLCWGSNDIETPVEKGSIVVIIGYNADKEYPFESNGNHWKYPFESNEKHWKYTLPITAEEIVKYALLFTKEELLEYSLEEQEK